MGARDERLEALVRFYVTVRLGGADPIFGIRVEDDLARGVAHVHLDPGLDDVERAGREVVPHLVGGEHHADRERAALRHALGGLEPEIETTLREKLGRGSITYILKMRLDSADAAYHVNTAALESYLQQLRLVKGLDGVARIDLASLMQLPGVCQEPRDESDEIAKHGDVIRELTNASIKKLESMRQLGLVDDAHRPAVRPRPQRPRVPPEHHGRLARMSTR